MNSAIVAAIKHQNYDTAARMIAALPPENPWGLLYTGQLHEAKEEWALAEQAYRDLLRQGGGPKITLIARQGLQRLSEQANAAQSATHQAQVAETLAQPGQDQPGLLIIHAVSTDQKAALAKAFAQIMACDVYSARMLLPSRGYRFYRSGVLGELQVFGQELQKAGIPATWHSLSDIHDITVVPVSYLKTLKNPVQVQVADTESQPFSFQWSEVTQRVEGLVPIFEQVVDRDRRGKLKRREETQDHAQFCDLHLPQRQCILRFYDTAYQFHQGVPLINTADQGVALDHETSWANWRALMACLDQHLPQHRAWNDFEIFANTALDHPDTLDKIHPHINLFRRSDSQWDQAFHLYSSLIYLNATSPVAVPTP